MKSLVNNRNALRFAVLTAAVLCLGACSGTDDGDEGDDSGSKAKHKVAVSCVSEEERPVCLQREFSARDLENWSSASVEEIDQAEFEDGSAERAAVDSCQICE